MWESAAGWSRFFITSTGLTIMDYTFNIATRISGSHIFGIFGVARKILANSHFIGGLGEKSFGLTQVGARLQLYSKLEIA